MVLESAPLLPVSDRSCRLSAGRQHVAELRPADVRLYTQPLRLRSAVR